MRGYCYKIVPDAPQIDTAHKAQEKAKMVNPLEQANILEEFTCRAGGKVGNLNSCFACFIQSLAARCPIFLMPGIGWETCPALP